MNTNTIGNMTESVVLSEFQKMEIPVSIPFGRNEPYDFVIDTKDGFKSVQVKHGIYKNGCVVAEITHKRTYKKTQKDSYKGVVDYIAIWCSQINKSYLLDMKSFRANKVACLRIEAPRNNSCISTIVWAAPYELKKIAALLKPVSAIRLVSGFSTQTFQVCRASPRRGWDMSRWLESWCVA